MKADLHVHSEFSWDSKVPIRNYIQEAKSKGIDIISITDHNDTRSHEVIKVLQQETKGLLWVPGQEVSTKDGHLLVYGWLPTIERDLSMADTVKRVKELGEELGVKVACITPHPYDFLRSGSGEKWRQSGVLGIETLNASSLFNYFNWKAKKRSEMMDIAKLGNSDCHRKEEFAYAYNELPECNTIEDVLDSLPKAIARGKRIGIRRKLVRFTRRKFGMMTD
ncbi:MAG: PHP domain-containing protein [Candidatus Heimdallarchaeota archaeon]|nr:PHP domain-containing protein [Candidatus Heimdallarchaeota archaeon]